VTPLCGVTRLPWRSARRHQSVKTGASPTRPA